MVLKIFNGELSFSSPAREYIQGGPNKVIAHDETGSKRFPFCSWLHSTTSTKPSVRLSCQYLNLIILTLRQLTLNP